MQQLDSHWMDLNEIWNKNFLNLCRKKINFQYNSKAILSSLPEYIILSSIFLEEKNFQTQL
jgi:hypothetical protein